MPVQFTFDQHRARVPAPLPPRQHLSLSDRSADQKAAAAGHCERPSFLKSVRITYYFS